MFDDETKAGVNSGEDRARDEARHRLGDPTSEWDEPFEDGPAHAADAPEDSEIEQVRDILFGDTRRETYARLRELEESVAALRADMMRLFADLEARVADGDAAVERRYLEATQGIGSALSHIGTQILSIARRDGA